MNVRAKREGVEEVFESQNVSRIMQEALAKRYHTSPHPATTSAPVAARPADDDSPTSNLSSAATLMASRVRPRLRTPAHYMVRRHSRTEHFLSDTRASCAHNSHILSAPCCGKVPSPATATTTTTAAVAAAASEDDGQGTGQWCWCEEEGCVASAVVAECLRHRSFSLLMEEDLREVCGLPDASLDRAKGRGSASAAPLTSWQEYFELPPRWVMQSLGAVDQQRLTNAAAWQERCSVTPLDVDATVAKRGGVALRSSPPSPQTAATPNTSSPLSPVCSVDDHYRVVATAPMSGGAYWVDVAPLGTSATALSNTAAPDHVERVDREDVYLDPPALLHMDPLLPCDEVYSQRGVNTGVYVFFLRALQQQQQLQQHQYTRRLERGSRSGAHLCPTSLPSAGAEVSSPATAAAALSLHLARCARRRRAELASCLQRLLWDSPSCGLRENESTSADSAHAVDATRPSPTPTPALRLQLEMRVDVARACVQLRARVEEVPASLRSSAAASRDPRQDGTASSLSPHKRAREGERREGGSPESTLVESPTVEVLLRSARKLAALYDQARASAVMRRQLDTHEGQGRSQPTSEQHGTVSEMPLTRPFSNVARDALEGLVREAEMAVDADAAASLGTDNATPNTTSATSISGSSRGWHTVVTCKTPGLSWRRQSGLPDEPVAADATSETEGDAFFGRLFTMLLRYRSLFGRHGYNQGPQAAVPPPIMEELSTAFAITAEAFASPLNVQLPQFGSLFPDTDAYFGSMGSFFDLMLGQASLPSEGSTSSSGGATPRAAALLDGCCHVEVNPPFDTALLRQMEEHLLTCLDRAAASEASLLFLIVLPSHDLDAAEATAEAATDKRDGGGRRQTALATSLPASKQTSATMSTDRALRESPYCLGHVLCAAAESVYVDGHQHLLESPFFCIGTPTRLILLGNAAAKARFPSASAQLEAVRASWKKLTASALRKRPDEVPASMCTP